MGVTAAGSRPAYKRVIEHAKGYGNEDQASRSCGGGNPGNACCGACATRGEGLRQGRGGGAHLDARRLLRGKARLRADRMDRCTARRAAAEWQSGGEQGYGGHVLSRDESAQE